MPYPLFLVQTEDDSVCLSVDYRKNSKTRNNAFSLPHIEESLDVLTRANWFSKMDLANGYS